MSRSIRIPCVLMRGGTSRGPFFMASDLPASRHERDEVLLSALGSGHELQVDGIGREIAALLQQDREQGLDAAGRHRLGELLLEKRNLASSGKVSDL